MILLRKWNGGHVLKKNEYDNLESQYKSHERVIADSELPYNRPLPKIGRNDPFPCGSGKKYKKCCGKK